MKYYTIHPAIIQDINLILKSYHCKKRFAPGQLLTQPELMQITKYWEVWSGYYNFIIPVDIKKTDTYKTPAGCRSRREA